MIGYHSVPVIVDAYNKGIRGYDVKKAYEAVVHASTYDTTDIFFPSKQVKNILMPKGKLYNETMDFIPADLENESVSKALEYAYNDWCIAQMAKDLGKTDDYNHFMKRSKKYTQYYDTKTGFMLFNHKLTTCLNNPWQRSKFAGHKTLVSLHVLHSYFDHGVKITRQRITRFNFRNISDRFGKTFKNREACLI